MNHRVTVAFVLPSGVEAGEFSVRIVEGGHFLEYTVKCLAPLVDLEVIHKKWLLDPSCEYQTYHPEFNGFIESVKPLRAPSTDWIEYSTRIYLPFDVENHIYHKINLVWCDNTVKMIYVCLKAVVQNYTVLKDKESFDIL